MTNLLELLKDAPYGTELWCTLYGEVYFISIDPNSYYPIKVGLKNSNTKVKLDKYGRYYDNFEKGECILFPSKDCRTWEGWKLPTKPNLNVGDWIASIDGKGDMAVERIVNLCGNKVILVDTDGCFAEYPEGVLESCRLWTIADARDGDVLISKSGNPFIFLEDRVYAGYHNIIAYCGINTMGNFCESSRKECWTYGTSLKPATKEDRELLFRKIKEAGYQWDADKKELKKISKHYDVANFKPKQWVLVRDCDEWEWALTRFSYLSNGSASLFVCINGASFQQCIPFEGNEHLLGTTDPCGEEFINWKT